MGLWNRLEYYFSRKERQLFIALSLIFVLGVMVIGYLYLYNPAWKVLGPEIRKSGKLVSQILEKGKVTFDNRAVTFEQNSANIKSESIGQIIELATALGDPQLTKIPFFYIDGHTCNLGSEKDNCELSQKRACTIKRLLVKHAGIGRDRVKIRGFGESCPVKPNNSETNRQENRRVVVRSSKWGDPGKACIKCEANIKGCK